MRTVGEIELPELHEEDAARTGARCVARLGRVADVAPHWKLVVLVPEHTLKHGKLLATAVHMG
jgi:hypothetical protein